MTQRHPHHTTDHTSTGNDQQDKTWKGQGSSVTSYTKHQRKTHGNSRGYAYSMPHPVPPKITPRARMVPATAPMSLLVAMFTVWRENGNFFLTEEITH